MTDALARLLENFIDYAGIFPPAKLEMKEAVENYLKYRQGIESRFLGRFVCSAARLEELGQAIPPNSEAIPISVIGASAADKENWGEVLAQDAQAMTRFMAKIGDRADIEAYEVRVPDHENLPEYLSDLRAFNQVDVYCELPWGPEMADSLGLIAEQDWIGAKARTGGLEAKAFPSSLEIAEFLQQCAQLDLVHKLTAGLHHPVRGYREEVKTKMHGFLNVLVASALLQAHDLTKKEVEGILDCEDATLFGFAKSQITFGEWSADDEDIASARSIFAGIGSCSVQEPMDDLSILGLL
jgi:hypothetical protein